MPAAAHAGLDLVISGEARDGKGKVALFPCGEASGAHADRLQQLPHDPHAQPAARHVPGGPFRPLRREKPTEKRPDLRHACRP